MPSKLLINSSLCCFIIPFNSVFETPTKVLPNIASAAKRIEETTLTPLVSATTISVVPPPISTVTMLVTLGRVFWKKRYGAIDSVIAIGSAVELKNLWYASFHKTSNKFFL